MRYANKLWLARVATCIIAYDAGYSRSFEYSKFMQWYNEVSTFFSPGDTTVITHLKPSVRGSLAYVDYLEKKNPGYLHETYRYSSNTIGAKASARAISECMNERSRIGTEACEDLNLARRNVTSWFSDNGGKEVSSIEKPLDTKEHKGLQLKWVREYIVKLTSILYYVA